MRHIDLCLALFRAELPDQPGARPFGLVGEAVQVTIGHFPYYFPGRNGLGYVESDKGLAKSDRKLIACILRAAFEIRAPPFGNALADAFVGFPDTGVYGDFAVIVLLFHVSCFLK